jgi:hypothetical protein
MEGGLAGTWANNVQTQMLDVNTPNPYATFAEFKVAFNKAFGNADRAQKARTELAMLKMKTTETVEEYTTAFESLAPHTGYDETALIEAYRTGLMHRIVEKIYSNPNGVLPASLDDWKAKARQLDTLYQEFRALQAKGAHGVTTILSRPPKQAPVRATVTQTQSVPAAPAPAKDPNAMDVDGGRRRSLRCYNCNKFGHISRNCPEPPKPYRSVRAAEIAEVVRAVIKEEQIKEEVPATEVKEGFQDSQQ